MTLTYDQEADALAIELVDGALVARTVQVDPGTLVDVDQDGVAIAIEVIHPARSWPLEAIVDDFRLAADDAAMLRALWSDSQPFPFVPDLAVA
jgi:uncharacterized protein YuzE